MSPTDSGKGQKKQLSRSGSEKSKPQSSVAGLDRLQRPGVLSVEERGPKLDEAKLMALRPHGRRSDDPSKSLQVLLPLHSERRLWQIADVRVGVEGVEMAEEVWHKFQEQSDPPEACELAVTQSCFVFCFSFIDRKCSFFRPQPMRT